MSELLAVTTVGGTHEGVRATTELSWPMSDFLPDDGGWYVKVLDHDWAEDHSEGEMRGARYAWHPQPAPPPLLPWLSVSRVTERWPDERVHNWLTGLFYGTGGIMVRARIDSAEITLAVHREPVLRVNGLRITRGDFWDQGIIRIIKTDETPDED